MTPDEARLFRRLIALLVPTLVFSAVLVGLVVHP